MLRRAQRTGGVLGLLVLGFIVVGGFVPMSAAVHGSGRLVVATKIKRVAHPTGGVVAQLFVHEGSLVVKGQPLVRLDSTVSGADAGFSALSLDQMLAERTRLEAERVGADALAFGPELAGRTDAGAVRAMADAQKLFDVRRREHAAEVAQLGDRIHQFGQQVVGYRRQIAANRTQQALIAPERAGIESLYAKGLVTINRRNQLARTETEFDASNGALEAQIAQTDAHVSEVRSQMIQIGETRRSEAATQLAALNMQINQQQIRHVIAGDNENRAIIRAPAAGIVDKLTIAAAGDVVKPIEPILEIVPAGDRLDVEATIESADIDQVHLGQAVDVRLSALNAARTPEAEGRIVFVAPEQTVDPQTQHSFYVVRVRLVPRARQYAAHLVPGMPAEIFLATGSRSFFAYLLKPLRDQIARTMRDND